MKHRFFALFIVFTFVLTATVFTFAQTKPNKNQLLALLPASDGVVSVDAKRFFDSALPQVLSGNKEMLDEINSRINEFKTNTTIDIRQFDQIAVGVAIKQISADKTKFEPLVLARGSFNANSLLMLAKFAAKETYREEKIGSRIVYIFSPKELIEKNKSAVKSSFVQRILDHLLPRLSGEIAVTAYDNNTLAFGRLERLKLMLDGSKSRVDNNLLALVNRNPNSVVSFAANLPNGTSGFLSLGDDELGQNLDSIRQIYGTADVAGENALVSFTAKTLEAKQAEGLHKNLSDLRELGKMLLGSSKSADKQVYARMLESAKITLKGSEVNFDLQIPQSDINVLIGAK